MSNASLERIAVALSIMGALFTLVGHSNSLERRLTVLETSTMKSDALEQRLTRLETIIEKLEGAQHP